MDIISIIGIISPRQKFISTDIFDSSYIRGYKSSGYIGYIDDSYLSGSGIMLGVKLTNFQFVTILDPYDEEYADNLMHSPIIGGVYGNIIIIKKVKNTPKKFPRGQGKPLKEPIR